MLNTIMCYLVQSIINNDLGDFFKPKDDERCHERR